MSDWRPDAVDVNHTSQCLISGYHHEPLQCADKVSQGLRGNVVLGKKQVRIMVAIPVALMLLISLLLHAPASLLAARLAPVLAAAGATAGGIAMGGTLLDGQLQAQRQGQSLFVAWQLKLGSLWRLAYGADIRLAGPIALMADWQKRPGSWSLALTDVKTQAGDAAWLQPQLVLPSWRSSQMQFSRTGDGSWQSGTGQLQTEGGLLRVNLQGQIQEMQIPASVLRWRVVNNNLVGELRQQADDGALAAITLTADQRIQWQIRERLLRLKPGYLGRNDLDLVVLTVSEPLSSQGG